jgi:hypothetical protein
MKIFSINLFIFVCLKLYKNWVCQYLLYPLYLLRAIGEDKYKLYNDVMYNFF